LHYSSVIAIHIVGLIVTDQAEALILRRFAKAGMTASGSPGHFPATAVPGGVLALADPAKVKECVELVPEALSAALRLVERSLGVHAPPDHFDGADLALVDDQGNLDLFGMALSAVSPDGGSVLDRMGPELWDEIVAEAVPGSSAPKPFIRALGASSGAYRVGPVAQLRVAQLATPQASDYKDQWRTQGHGAACARAIIILHCVETIVDLLANPDLVTGTLITEWSANLSQAIGVGWVDGARGLLVHRYETTEDARVKQATILTPTAQNEPWLGGLLRRAAQGSGKSVQVSLEDAIRTVDPCLPCSSAPAGTMDLVVDTVST
jgi:NAD-reducing hydrogenase large subunit